MSLGLHPNRVRNARPKCAGSENPQEKAISEFELFAGEGPVETAGGEVERGYEVGDVAQVGGSLPGGGGVVDGASEGCGGVAEEPAQREILAQIGVIVCPAGADRTCGAHLQVGRRADVNTGVLARNCRGRPSPVRPVGLPGRRRTVVDPARGL
ncbi:hypothetical protein RW1_026_01380 [Rhodococcus wratislaviensis NBRC 100605]|uniref:Uncharacterized protein n=1 Tax=Rhodococcus wratislaviensis NBRC 100605 TaxID=1219028 RepID=X0PSA3_RHOWR|nr:hypothetical protein RW1_026_01380 [Rhodococcus wratislaviensis NBRC 100605]